MAGRITRKARINISHEAREVSVVDGRQLTPILFLSSRLLGGPNNREV